MNNKICLLINHKYDFDYQSQIIRFLPARDYEVDVLVDFPENPDDYKLIVAISYQKIVKDAGRYKNFFIVHSSDLPSGRGWASIYYTLWEDLPVYTITFLTGGEKVDSGKVVAKLSFPVLPSYTAPSLRIFDFSLTLYLIQRIIYKWPDGNIDSVEQDGAPSYRSRRNPEQNQVKLEDSILSIIHHLRGCEPAHPAFFIYKDVKYLIAIKPEIAPEFPSKICIDFPALNHKENLEILNDPT